MVSAYIHLSQIDHEIKSIIDKHLQTLKHENNKKNANNSNHLIQRIILLLTGNTLNEREKINIEVVEAFTFADIPLEKIEKLKPFLIKYCKNGGLITGANQLREKYLPLSYEIELQNLKNSIIDKIICIIIDKTTDCCDRHTVNLLFSFDNQTKFARTEFLSIVLYDEIYVDYLLISCDAEIERKTQLIARKLTI
ncbi:hypothetical protein C1646_750051 [Rhizophagus diaphanus]|nr:hypothetical protein C1646_750051 [Rhizophagus diaphanus] [Rhizophagus sp. MUCL 43196]